MKNGSIDERKPGAGGAIPIFVVLFLIADVLLVSQVWFLDGGLLWASMALPLSQCSLATIWAATATANVYARFAAASATALFSWYVLAQILPWGIGDPISAAWAIAFAVQALSIVLEISLFRAVLAQLQRRKAGGGHRGPRHLAFELRTLMLWTTLIALGFAFVHFGRATWQWSPNIDTRELLEAMPIIGLFNAQIAMVACWAFAIGTWRRKIVKSFIVAVSTAALGCLLPSLIEWATGVTTISIRNALILGLTQSVILAVVLASNGR